MDLKLEERFPRRPECVADARHFVAEALDDSPLDVLSDDAELLTSEVATNAIQHGDGGSIRIQLIAHDNTLFIKVSDGGGTTIPQPRNGKANPLAESGRGINILEYVADAWGFERGKNGTVVWFRLGGSLNGSSKLH